MKILNGKKTAEVILKNISSQIKSENTKPALAVILIGKDKASELYVKIKKEKAKKVGIDFFLFRFKESSSEEEIVEKIKELNEDEKINGIIVQLPLPKKFNTQKIINSVRASKDVDGFSAQGGKNILEPVFPMAIIKLLESSKQKLIGKKAIVISNSKLFGETMSESLRKKKIKAEYVLRSALSPALSQREREIGALEKIKNSDIIITAVGEKGIIKGEMVKSGVIVIDGGISKKGKKVFGDVDSNSMKNISGFISPVPGGVGPMTVACLLQNVWKAFKAQR